jgi:integrase
MAAAKWRGSTASGYVTPSGASGRRALPSLAGRFRRVCHPCAGIGRLGRSAIPEREGHHMPAASAALGYEERLAVLAELGDYPPGEQLLARLVILDGVALPRALRARVADVDLTHGRLTLTGKHARARVVALDVGAAELAARAVGQRPPSEPLFVGHRGRALHPERFRRSILAAARRAGVPASLTVLRPAALIPA